MMQRMWWQGPVFRDPEAKEGEIPGGDSLDGGNPSVPADVQALIRRQANGNAELMVQTLWRQGLAYRKRHRSDLATIEGYQKAENEGRLLKPEEKKELDAFRALKMKPEDVTKLVEAKTALEARDAERSRREELGKVAEAAGWKPKVLTGPAFAHLHFEVKEQEVEEEGEKKTVQVAMVRPKADDKAPLVPALEFIEKDAELKELLPALRASAGEGDTPPARTGVRFPAQSSTPDRAPANTETPAKKHVARTYVTPSQRRENSKTKE